MVLTFQHVRYLFALKEVSLLEPFLVAVQLEVKALVKRFDNRRNGTTLSTLYNQAIP